MSHNFEEFFLEGIDKSVSIQELLVDDAIKWYLASLLDSSVRNGISFAKASQTLTELYLYALQARSISERNLYLKTIGDLTLIKLGMFPESISREIVNPSFYRGIGLNAFTIISKNNEVYNKIISSYDDMVSILHGYKKLSDIDNIPNLYEFWKVTDSKFAFKRLIKLGFQFSYWNNIEG